MHETLKNCPFCGAAAHFEMDEGRWEWVECESCGMQGNRSASLMEDCKPKLVEAWNRRAPAPAGVEPVAWRVRMLDSPNYWIIFLHKPVDALMDPKREVQPLYTALQPTQAQAGAVPMYRLLQSGVDRIEAADEFLSDDTTTWAIDPNGIFVGNIYGGHVLRPARRRIKGGQHGTDN